MSQIDPDFASIKIIATQYSDSWFNEVIIESLTHGMYTALLAVVTQRILSSTTTRRRQVKVLAGISVFMYIMATMHLAMTWIYTRWAFITKGETEETRYFALMNPMWALTISDIVAGINIFTTDGVTIWRCWIIWERNWRVVILPCICTMCGLIFGILYFLQLLEPSLHSQENSSGRTSIRWGLAYYIMALPTTIICTTLIVYRLVKAIKSKSSPHFMPNLYHHVIEILVESSALYVVVLAVFIVFDWKNTPYSMYPGAVRDFGQGIAPALILLRVVSRNMDTGPSRDDMHPLHLQCLPRSEREGSEAVAGDSDVMLIGPEKTAEVV
ncbi:uncharacterized protein EV420DRAFT_1752892 [Desarmillaria tabescens]|uniref:Uncharacterized protein n=1 Tax=Armillaria tabescens TaxID=1929756 RepID=A0AA39JB26_ARMTA|nr:uncharacterized protein EV420DRAFT_1752892 [Desarmillaria tabescens]KAK0439491.1 hypothetical protein EV420DRAFT_1752892 [Desarmillaria tabescens]